MLLAELLAAACFASGALAEESAPSAGGGQAEILSIGGYAPSLSMRFVMPFEHMLREKTADVAVSGIDDLPASCDGNAYRYRFAGDSMPAASSVPVRALENSDGFFLLSPAEPELMAEFLRQARGYPLLPPTSERTAILGVEEDEKGKVLTVSINSPRKTADQRRSTLATIYHLKVRGRPVDAVFLMKVSGGLGRLASALDAARKPGAPQVIASRGDWEFRDSRTALHGRALLDALEGMGLRASAVGRGELRHWDELRRYLRERPAGIRFLSANIVSSSSGAPVLAPTAVLEAGGLRIGFLGLTRPSYAKYLGRGPLQGLAVGDPIEAARGQIRDLRSRADLVVVLSNLDHPGNARLRDGVRGIDAIIGDSEPYPAEGPDPKVWLHSETRRGPFSTCLLLASEFEGLDKLEFSVGPRDDAGYRRMEVRQSHAVLDESFADKEGLPHFTAAEFATASSSEPALIPPARELFPGGNRYSSSAFPRIVSRDFWTLAASLMADRTRAEFGILPVTAIDSSIPGDYTEGQVRNWFGWDDALATFELTGEGVLRLLREVRAEEERERKNLPPAEGQLRLAAAGAEKIDGKDSIHGVPIDKSLVYKVAGSELLLANADAYPALTDAKNIVKAGELKEEVLDDLRRRAAARWPASRYLGLMEGRAVRQTPLWTLNFRDLGIGVTNTKVVKDPGAFSQVPNSRVQGFDERLVGVTAKVDLERRFSGNKWGNSLEAEYSESRLQPPNQPAVLNFPTNRISFLTMGTLRWGSFPAGWLANSYGPSAGLQYDGEVRKRRPDLKRRNIYSAFPGVEFFDGSVIESLQLSGNLRRDYSVDPPVSQYGLRARTLLKAPVPLGRESKANLQGELWTNYFFRTPRDTIQDLTLEGDASLKLDIPVWKQLSLAPFIDVYFFKLKVRPAGGYSAITGLSLSFSRLWKPQYEKF